MGWFDSPFNYKNSYGRRSGYAYEYQQKIATYTDWKYEYVEGSWPELLEKLKAGEIDMLSDVSYTEERASEMLFSSYPMGAENYYIFILSDNDEIKSSDSATLEGKRIGVNKNSFQETLLKEWAEKNGIQIEVVEQMGSENESVEMLRNGEIDAYVTMDAYGDLGPYVPSFKIGQSEFYFALNNSRPDLLNELNSALRIIQEEDRLYNQQLYDQFVRNIGTNVFLASEEVEWLSNHGKIRVGYLDGYMPFCDTDPKTGKLTGALSEYLELASHATKNVETQYTAQAYPSVDAALDALKAGEIDCVFPVNLSAHDEEEQELSVTRTLMDTEMYAAIRKTDHLRSLSGRKMTVALSEGNSNYEVFLRDLFPDWEKVYCDGAEACYRAVEAEEADCTLFSNFRIAQTEPLRKRYNLTPVPTGKAMKYSFAVRRSDRELYLIMDKLSGLVSKTSIESALLSYSWPEERFSLTEYLMNHLMQVIAVILVFSALIVLLLIRRAERIKRHLEERLALQNQLLTQEREKRQSDTMIRAMSADYRSVFYINLDRDEAVCYRADPKTRSCFLEGGRFPFRKRLEKYAEEYVAPADREEFLHFVDPEHIRAALERDGVIAHRYLTLKGGEEQYELLRIAGVPAAEKGVHELGMGFSDVDRETRESIAHRNALSAALTEAKAANKAKTTFLSSMSHEIRTPMNAIIGLDTLALRDENLSAQTRDYLEKISRSARHLLELINDILDMSRIESGRMVLRREEFSFSAMLEQINTMVMSQMCRQGSDL